MLIVVTDDGLICFLMVCQALFGLFKSRNIFPIGGGCLKYPVYRRVFANIDDRTRIVPFQRDLNVGHNRQRNL